MLIRFLLAQLHMDSLRNQPTIGDIRLTLKSLPRGVEGLNETYNQAMTRIEGQAEKFKSLANKLCFGLRMLREHCL